MFHPEIKNWLKIDHEIVCGSNENLVLELNFIKFPIIPRIDQNIRV